MDDDSCLLGLFGRVVAPVEYRCIYTIVVRMDQERLPLQQRSFSPDFGQNRMKVFSCQHSVAVRKLQQLSQSWAGKPRGHKEHGVSKPGKRDDGDNNVNPGLGQNSDDGGLLRGRCLCEANTLSVIRRCHAVIYPYEDYLRRGIRVMRRSS